MKEFAGFPPETIVLVVTVSLVYFVTSWAPVLWPIMATHRRRKEFPRRWLFVLTITLLSYGAIVALLCMITVPISAYEVYIAPTLHESGIYFAEPILRANQFIARWWWLLLPPALISFALYFVRKLTRAWPDICQALTANNSFKPTPLRGVGKAS